MMARAGEEIGVNLAVSLHAVTKEVRDEIVPINKNYGIDELLTACAAIRARTMRGGLPSNMSCSRTRMTATPMRANWCG